jgi:hypothetical protein
MCATYVEPKAERCNPEPDKKLKMKLRKGQILLVKNIPLWILDDCEIEIIGTNLQHLGEIYRSNEHC